MINICISPVSTIRLFLVLALSVGGLSVVSTPGGGVPTSATLIVEGCPCHGGNSFNNAPLTDYANAAPFLPAAVLSWWSTFHVEEVGVVDPDPLAIDSTVIDASTPLDSVIATHLPPIFADPQVLIDRPEMFNIPIHESYVVVNGLSGERDQLPAATPGLDKLALVRQRAEPVTLGEWNEANGHVRLTCFADGTGRVRITARNLTPHVVYTVWQVFAVTDPLPPGFPPISASPMGGAPHYFVPNKHGRAVYERDLHYCPLDTDTTPLMYISLFQHWDHSLYGTSPDGSWQGFPFGLVAADHLCFPTGDFLLDAEHGK